MNLLTGITLVLSFVVIFLPHRWAVLGVMSSVIYLTQDEFLVVGGINIWPIRLIILFGFIRVIIRNEFSFSKLNKIDKSLLIFISIYLLVFVVRAHLNPSPLSNLMYRLGLFVDGFLSYFMFRGLLNDPRMFRQFLKDAVFLILPFAIFMVVESVTGESFFTVIGIGSGTPLMRQGQYRAQASFRHAITAGSVGAILLPLFLGLRAFSADRFRAVIGILLCLSITVAAHSSGPLVALFGGLAAWMCWPLRKKMWMVRRSIVGFLVLLAVVMKAPVWFIIARASDVIGGDGWHRANIFGRFVNSFDDWWLMGMPLEETRDWAATILPWGAVDLTNEYANVGISGGLISLILFIWLIKNCYQSLGHANGKIRGDIQTSKQYEALLWGLGAALFSHTVNFFGVTYFDQFWVMWYMILAVISGITGYFLEGNSSLTSEEFHSNRDSAYDFVPTKQQNQAWQ